MLIIDKVGKKGAVLEFDPPQHLYLLRAVNNILEGYVTLEPLQSDSVDTKVSQARVKNEITGDNKDRSELACAVLKNCIQDNLVVHAEVNVVRVCPIDEDLEQKLADSIGIAC